ncbi:MAG TPA: hypothetical protein VFJ58_10895 [Armatimonadota bacterium]|nr:hypothetical protein [Armatimonadota bacterium]
MKSSINGPIGIVVIVIVVIAACAAGYLYLRGPAHASPEENMAHLRAAQNYKPSAPPVSANEANMRAAQSQQPRH